MFNFGCNNRMCLLTAYGLLVSQQIIFVKETKINENGFILVLCYTVHAYSCMLVFFLASMIFASLPRNH